MLNKKNVYTVLGLVIIFALLAISFHVYELHGATKGPHTLTIGNQNINLIISNTEAEREQGLSDRASLPQNQAMLFVFDMPSIYSFWMKDMNFSLDMIWLDSSYHIVYIAPNVTPESYPAAYQSADPAQYVIEADAGFAEAHNLKVGDELDIH